MAPDDGKIAYKDLSLSGIPRGVMAVVALGAFLLAAWWLARPELVVVERARAQEADMHEYLKHLGQPPAASYKFVDQDHDKYTVGLFSDRCLLVQTETDAGTRNTLIRNLALDRDKPPGVAALPFEAVVEAQGRCVPPQQHSGRFVEQKEQVGCWILLHRRWEDGCDLVVVAYDSCHNTYAPGSWARCVH